MVVSQFALHHQVRKQAVGGESTYQWGQEPPQQYRMRLHRKNAGLTFRRQRRDGLDMVTGGHQLEFKYFDRSGRVADEQLERSIAEAMEKRPNTEMVVDHKARFGTIDVYQTVRLGLQGFVVGYMKESETRIGSRACGVGKVVTCRSRHTPGQIISTQTGDIAEKDVEQCGDRGRTREMFEHTTVGSGATLPWKLT